MLRYLRSLPCPAPRPALFLDRDGVLNRRRAGGYITSPEHFELLDVALDAARSAQAAGAALVVVTNQGAIARQMASERDIEAVHRLLIESLELSGIALDAIYVCPHHPLAPIEALRYCWCRKPKPGLITQAIRDLNLDVRRSTLLGDQASDVEAARAAGITRPLLVGAGTPCDLRRAVLANVATTDPPLMLAGGRASSTNS